MKNLLFYFSATGNSLQVAKDIAAEIGDSEVINLAEFDTSRRIRADRVGFIFPVYYWGIPNILKTFLKKIKFKNDPYLFAVATCGHTFGASLNQVNDLLKQNGQKLHSGFAIRMPENYIISYNADNEDTQRRLFIREKAKVAAIARVLDDKKVQRLEISKIPFSGLVGKPINESSSKSFAERDRDFNVNGDCTGCGLCERSCPVHNIKMVKGNPEWLHHCELCLACLQHCPAQAINYKNQTQKRKRYVNPNV